MLVRWESSPGLVMCCTGFVVSSEYVHSTDRQTRASGKQGAYAESAISSAPQDRKQEKLWEQPSLGATDKLRLSPPYSASPHTSSPGSSNEEEDSGNDSPVLGLSPSRGPVASDSPCSRSPKDEEEEEDALKYVREIFFS